MTKTVLVSALAVMLAVPANAGLLDGLFGKKDAEPKTLEEACNKDEITALCPEVVLGTKTIQDCLIDNVSGVSKKCATYVKKSITEKVDGVKQKIAGVADGAESATAEQKQEIAAKRAAAQSAKEDLKKSLQETKAAARAVIDAEREQFNMPTVAGPDAK